MRWSIQVPASMLILLLGIVLLAIPVTWFGGLMVLLAMFGTILVIIGIVLIHDEI